MVRPAVVRDGWILKNSAAAVEGRTLNAVLVAGVRPEAAAPSVYPLAATLTSSVENVATPAIAARVRVPPSAPGLGVSDMVTLFPKLVTVLPNASCAATLTAGKMLAPTVTFDGWTMNTSWLAVPGVMLNVLDCADV